MSNEYNHLSQQISILSARVDQVASQVAQMSRPPVPRESKFYDGLGEGPVNVTELGKRIPVKFSDPEMQRAYDAGETFKTPDERRIEELESAMQNARVVARVHEIESKHTTGLAAAIMATAVIEGLVRPGDALYAVPVDQSKRIEELERALAGMLFEFDDGVNGGHRESPDENVPALDYARTLIEAKEFKA